MLKSIAPQGKHIIVNGGYQPPIYFNNGSMILSVGNLRYNPNSQSIEVYDGYNWQTMTTSSPTIGLSYEAENALDWAIQKRKEDMELEALAKSNQVIADLMEQRKQLDGKLKMVQTLIKEENKVGTS